MDNTNQFLDLSAIYGIPPCPGGDCTSNPADFNQRPLPQQGMQTIPTMPPSQQQGVQTPFFPQGVPMQTVPQQGQGVNPLAPITPMTQPMPMTVESLQYLNGFMRTQIGRMVRVEFLIGTNTLVDKTGTLLAVGANYILINEANTDDILACDFYNIKFINFFY